MNMTARFAIDNIEVDTLIKALEGFPKDAKIRVVTYTGDRFSYGDTHELEVSWTK